MDLLGISFFVYILFHLGDNLSDVCYLWTWFDADTRISMSHMWPNEKRQKQVIQCMARRKKRNISDFNLWLFFETSIIIYTASYETIVMRLCGYADSRFDINCVDTKPRGLIWLALKPNSIVFGLLLLTLKMNIKFELLISICRLEFQKIIYFCIYSTEKWRKTNWN